MALQCYTDVIIQNVNRVGFRVSLNVQNYLRSTHNVNDVLN